MIYASRNELSDSRNVLKEKQDPINSMIDKCLLQLTAMALRNADGTLITGMYLFYLIRNV